MVLLAKQTRHLSETYNWQVLVGIWEGDGGETTLIAKINIIKYYHHPHTQARVLSTSTRV